MTSLAISMTSGLITKMPKLEPQIYSLYNLLALFHFYIIQREKRIEMMYP
jgi:hypothetical protein